ncbi:MAG: ATP-binding cassette domain-containing protein [Bacteroidales bacterium]|nr:ATP-binding cassette domain-containing protein [Bacteroidales bacterium]
MDKNELLKVSDVSFYYGTEKILKSINLSVMKGDFIGVIGPNGGGKTTLLKIILGLLKPKDGEVVFNLSEMDKSDIGYLPQMSESDLSFPLSVRDVILSGLMHKKTSGAKMSRNDISLANHIIEDLGLSTLRKKRLDQLSGGELQRVYLGRALVGSPKLLLLDEPGNFVDSTFEQDFYDKLKELNQEISILMVSHDVGTISAYVKSFACINRELHYHDSGRITNEQLKGYGCPIQLIAHGDVPHTVLDKHDH